jgi:hypothetical protein
MHDYRVRRENIIRVRDLMFEVEERLHMKRTKRSQNPKIIPSLGSKTLVPVSEISARSYW